MTGWLKPAVILGALFALVAANVVEFRSKRRDASAWTASLRQGSPRDQIALRQYQQTQNIEQLLHVAVSTLLAILVCLLWT